MALDLITDSRRGHPLSRRQLASRPAGCPPPHPGASIWGWPGLANIELKSVILSDGFILSLAKREIRQADLVGAFGPICHLPLATCHFPAAICN